jgi:hypothetical protein
MVRGEWKKREPETNTKKNSTNSKEQYAQRETADGGGGYRGDSVMDVDDSDSEENAAVTETEEEISDLHLGGKSQSASASDSFTDLSNTRHGTAAGAADAAVDQLVEGIGSLNLVPHNVRFGRGGRKVGFENPQQKNLQGYNNHRGAARGGRGAGRARPHVQRGPSSDGNYSSFDEATASASSAKRVRTPGPRPQGGVGRAGIIQLPGRGLHNPRGRGAPIGRGGANTRGRGRGRGQASTSS